MGLILQIIIPLILLIGLAMYLTSRQEMKEKISKKLKEKNNEFNTKIIIYGNFKHMAGLTVNEGANVDLFVCDDKVIMESNGIKFNLDNDKILDVTIKSESEIKEAYVSSIGGAVGGAVLFGPLGAMIGGRAKKKTDKTVKNYLIFTYDKGDKTDFISFEILNFLNADKIVKYFKDSANKTKKEINL